MGGMVVVPAPGSDLEGEMLLRAWREASVAAGDAWKAKRAADDAHEEATSRREAAADAVARWVRR